MSIPRDQAVPTSTVDTLAECKDIFQIHCVKNRLAMTTDHFASFIVVAMGLDRVRDNDIRWESLVEMVQSMERPVITVEDNFKSGPVINPG